MGLGTETQQSKSSKSCFCVQHLQADTAYNTKRPKENPPRNALGNAKLPPEAGGLILPFSVSRYLQVQ